MAVVLIKCRDNINITTKWDPTGAGSTLTSFMMELVQDNQFFMTGHFSFVMIKDLKGKEHFINMHQIIDITYE